MRSSLRLVWLAASFSAVAGLAGCGGNGEPFEGSEPTANPGAPAPSPTPAPAPAPIAPVTPISPSPQPDPEPIAPDEPSVQYEGTIEKPCTLSRDVTQQSNGRPVYVVQHLVTAAKDERSLAFAAIDRFYAGTDTTCSGTPLAVRTNAAAGNNIALIGKASVSLAGTTVTADLVVIFSGAADGGVSTGAATVEEGLVFPAGYFSRTATERTVWYRDAARLYYGSSAPDAPRDASGFPLQLLPQPYPFSE